MLYNIKFTIAYIAEKQYLCSEIINHLIIAIMKEKLTKNDGMSKECSQICNGIFDTTSDFDVMVAAFEATIDAHGLWEDYFKWFAQELLNGEIGGTYSLWKSWARQRPPMMWSNQAFIWEATDVDYTRWYQIDSEWRYWLMLNVYKF